ncbi:MAG TPA: alpha/beta hydrolase [Candidatus Nanopelagicaceae bacterium]|nr:alpha/beta hydrolase [Candidatus Nanopelagicaceae bacterium]
MLAFERVGKGAPIILAHGITESHHTWDPLVSELATTYDVVAPDLRGHGESTLDGPFDLMTMAADIAELVDHLGLENPLMVGHSLGGIVVSGYATQFPCRGVINVDQSLALSSFKELLAPLEGALKGSVEQFNEAISLMFSMMRGALDDASWHRISELRRPKQEVVLGVWSVIFDSPVSVLDEIVESVASAVKVPYLSLHGTDPGPDYAPWLTRLLPTAQVEIWDGDGHYPHLVEPARFIERVRSFDASL